MFQSLKKFANFHDPFQAKIFLRKSRRVHILPSKKLSNLGPFEVPRRAKKAVNDQNPHHWLPRPLL